MTRDEETNTEESPLLGSASPAGESGASLQDVDSAKKPISSIRGALIILSLGVLVLVQGTPVISIRYTPVLTFPAMNITMLTTTQSAVAADLDAFSEASWLTSSYLIAMSSISPLYGRLSQIFSPRMCICVATVISATGGIVTSLAGTLIQFVLGRAVVGAGAAGVMTVATILILEATTEKRRGLFIGCLNAGFTIGVALGAVVAGELQPIIGWVRFLKRNDLPDADC